ncbi:adenosylcobinamide kinase [Bacillaceae bacterium SIJ1]|uniref:MBL fold metallo-hydrolase n=1 Tax=Litoribacterium kuwaitense TaxID=1398745 RepID=UPI0013EBB3AD|nr:MBL fold metallo-hydrolase [Litoribacterium kuwaitense]NGP43825.1 adenosylcobinamide kinase [Litoribacterium kuwaitense]
MKITFLGTAAADQIPSPYCDCPRCEFARKHRGRDMRKRCCYLINDDLLVDIGPDLLVACSLHDVHLLNVKHTLVTHSHRDHFDIANLVVRKQGFQSRSDIPQMNFVAPPSVMTLLNTSGVKDSAMGIQRVPILPYDEVDLSPYQVKALKATHYPTVGDAVNFIIDDGQSTVLIASDTAVYKDEVWAHLENVTLDQLIIECTVGTNTSFKAGQERHLSIDGVQYMIEKMREMNVVTDETQLCATHFTHQHCPSHEELSQVLSKLGVECAYDGFILTV